MNPQLQARLKELNLTSVFNALIPSRQKEISKYLNYLKTDEALQRNIEKVVKMLEEKRTSLW